MAIKHVLRSLLCKNANTGATAIERPGAGDGNQACSQVSSLQKCMHTRVYIQGYCQRLVSIWIVINVCNLEINLFGPDWKISRHYWVKHCVLQHISNDWRVWNSEQAFALRWIEQQNSLKGFCMGEHSSMFEIYQKLLLYISHLKVRAQCIACATITNKSFKKVMQDKMPLNIKTRLKMELYFWQLTDMPAANKLQREGWN